MRNDTSFILNFDITLTKTRENHFNFTSKNKYQMKFYLCCNTYISNIKHLFQASPKNQTVLRQRMKLRPLLFEVTLKMKVEYKTTVVYTGDLNDINIPVYHTEKVSKKITCAMSKFMNLQENTGSSKTQCNMRKTKKGHRVRQNKAVVEGWFLVSTISVKTPGIKVHLQGQ